MAQTWNCLGIELIFGFGIHLLVGLTLADLAGTCKVCSPYGQDGGHLFGITLVISARFEVAMPKSTSRLQNLDVMRTQLNQCGRIEDWHPYGLVAIDFGRVCRATRHKTASS